MGRGASDGADAPPPAAVTEAPPGQAAAAVVAAVEQAAQALGPAVVENGLSARELLADPSSRCCSSALALRER